MGISLSASSPPFKTLHDICSRQAVCMLPYVWGEASQEHPENLSTIFTLFQSNIEEQCEQCKSSEASLSQKILCHCIATEPTDTMILFFLTKNTSTVPPIGSFVDIYHHSYPELSIKNYISQAVLRIIKTELKIEDEKELKEKLNLFFHLHHPVLVDEIIDSLSSSLAEVKNLKVYAMVLEFYAQACWKTKQMNKITQIFHRFVCPFFNESSTLKDLQPFAKVLSCCARQSSTLAGVVLSLIEKNSGALENLQSFAEVLSCCARQSSTLAEAVLSLIERSIKENDSLEKLQPFEGVFSYCAKENLILAERVLSLIERNSGTLEKLQLFTKILAYYVKQNSILAEGVLSLIERTIKENDSLKKLYPFKEALLYWAKENPILAERVLSLIERTIKENDSLRKLYSFKEAFLYCAIKNPTLAERVLSLIERTIKENDSLEKLYPFKGALLYCAKKDPILAERVLSLIERTIKENDSLRKLYSSKEALLYCAIKNPTLAERVLSLIERTIKENDSLEKLCPFKEAFLYCAIEDPILAERALSLIVRDYAEKPTLKLLQSFIPLFSIYLEKTTLPQKNKVLCCINDAYHHFVSPFHRCSITSLESIIRMCKESAPEIANKLLCECEKYANSALAHIGSRESCNFSTLAHKGSCKSSDEKSSSEG